MRRFYIYVSKGRGARGKGQGIWSRDLAVPGERLPEWMIELADQVKMIEAELLTAGPLLPTGVIVGSAVIQNVTPGDQVYEWHLSDVRRLPRPRKPTRQPQPAAKKAGQAVG